ncbi:hypothetical protein [Amycolatopsis suaedae]|uniref:Uncharacterized protein n=1 Tax=Amycolatopsis suaedae TaxID=2510978 RepID=A0A4Q7J532_9PSEU|nr:hypothetical protein [Amycolatopsis suaedae]RZQ61928.1 hypothetical protein EWH70_20145 [Amycolatopsis suaedae]
MSDDTSVMKATLDSLVREQGERRALRDQRAEELKARAQEYMTKQVQTAERYVEHRRELGRRKTKSGWSTDRSHAEPAQASAFDDPDEIPGKPPEVTFTPGAPAPAPVAPATPPPPAPAPVRAAPEPVRRARRPRPADDDEDDAFLNNRWAD